MTTPKNMKRVEGKKEKTIFQLHRQGLSYGEIAKIVGGSRQNIHRIIKYKKHIIWRFRFINWEIRVTKVFRS